MATPRLTTALSEGLLTLDKGAVVVMRPGVSYDLSSLPMDRVWIDHGFMPERQFWADSGYPVDGHPNEVAACIVVVPRSKALARAMIADACEMAPLVIVDGQRTDGVDSLYKDLRKLVGDMASVPKAHGRLFWFESPEARPDWTAQPRDVAEGYVTQPGVFSEGGVDKGTAQLIAALPAKLPARMADLGAGWGYLGGEVLKSHPEIDTMDMVEAERLAVDCAHRNVTDPRAVIHWADATCWTPEAKLGGIVANPPFHTSRAADPSLGRDFIAAAARMLTPTGHLWLVANRHLPYEATLGDYFGRFEEIGGSGGFKLFHAHRPKK